jgi:hypothetical protein
MRLEGLGKLKTKCIQVIGSRTRYLPDCSIVPRHYVTACPHATSLLATNWPVVKLACCYRVYAHRCQGSSISSPETSWAPKCGAFALHPLCASQMSTAELYLLCLGEGNYALKLVSLGRRDGAGEGSHINVSFTAISSAQGLYGGH